MNNSNSQKPAVKTLNTWGEKLVFWAIWIIAFYSVSVLAGSFIVSKLMNCS